MSTLAELREDLAEIENVDDQEEDVSLSADLFSISSFGVDYPAETLVSRMHRQQFVIPHFQRLFVWSQNQASRFIESLLLGLPVPGIFLFKERDTGKHLIIDGQQRLSSLFWFYDGTFNDRKFRLSGIETNWNGLSYSQLDDADRARLDDAVIHATVFQQDLPQGQMNSVYEVFERINTGGVKLSPQEIRSCICHGPFNEFLHKLNDNENWRSIYGPKSKRLKDVELILRFFAFVEWRDQYSSPMKHFLNDYMQANRFLQAADLSWHHEVFTKTMRFIDTNLGDRPFRPDRSLNTAVFDAVSSAIAIRLYQKPDVEIDNVNRRYLALLDNPRFVEGYVRATADSENVKKRMEEAERAFATE